MNIELPMNVRVLRRNADRAEAMAGVASGYGEHGLANLLYRFEHLLRERANDEIRAIARDRNAMETSPATEPSIVAHVRERLREVGMSQADAAATLGITQKHMSQVLTGKAQASFDLLVRLADLVDLELILARRQD